MDGAAEYWPGVFFRSIDLSELAGVLAWSMEMEILEYWPGELAGRAWSMEMDDPAGYWPGVFHRSIDLSDLAGVLVWSMEMEYWSIGLEYWLGELAGRAWITEMDDPTEYWLGVSHRSMT